MSDTKKYLDLEGLGTYHGELVQRLTDLEYDPNRMFTTKAQLFSLNKWGNDKFGRIIGLKEGLIITVANEIWQLVSPETFSTILRMDLPLSIHWIPVQRSHPKKTTLVWN